MQIGTANLIARRALGAAALASLAVLACPSTARADDGIRLSWQDFAKDPAKVASLRKAVAVMKSRNSADHSSIQYRLSWEYWANMHGYFGPDSPDGTVAENKQGIPAKYLHYFQGVTDTTAPDQVAKDVWAMCQHGTPWFFAWHRLYLYWFEKQLQAASGDSSLRLPYWDYTNTSQLAMPVAISAPTYDDDKGASQLNPLYEPRRAPGWASGAAKLNGTATNIDNALKLTNFTAYQNRIEGGVHGYVHCTVAVTCPVVDMGSVPYSSNDPVFWSHHANIDRMWSCWSNIAGNKNPSDPSFVNQKYSFVDPAGKEVTNTVGELFTGKLIDYKYEQEVNCRRAGGELVAAAKSSGQVLATAAATDQTPAPSPAEPQQLTAPTAPLALTKLQTKLKLSLPQGGAHQRILGQALQAEGAPSETHLILDGISYQAHPGTIFNVYLESTRDPKKRAQVGTLSFFALPPAVAAKGGHAHHDAAAASEDFDVTDALRDIAGGNASLADVTVSFEATTGREGTSETAEINAKAKLTINKISLQVEPAGK